VETTFSISKLLFALMVAGHPGVGDPAASSQLTRRDNGLRSRRYRQFTVSAVTRPDTNSHSNGRDVERQIQDDPAWRRYRNLPEVGMIENTPSGHWHWAALLFDYSL
jgi:hypothetical protein